MATRFRQQKKALATILQPAPFGNWRISLWLIVLGGILFFWPTCLDRYLAPRFFFLSGALLVSIYLVWKDLRENENGRFHPFDLLLLGWYGLNLASVTWSLSWSEGIFYAQKVLLLFGVYWFLRQALLRNAEMVQKTMGQITLWITGIVCVTLLVQIGLAVAQTGLDNETLYDYASGLFGNKSLAAEFLFFLLVFNVLFVAPTNKYVQKSWVLGGILGLISLLILVMQVRTALVATILGLSVYCLIRVCFEAAFRKTFFRRILPAGILGIGLFIGLLYWKGGGSSIVERLNPLNYLESATSNERRFVWYKTDLLNVDHYWLGVGNGSWKFWMPSKNISGGYRLAEKNIVFTRAHNDYLEIRSEMGIIGVIWFCALFGLALIMAGWSVRQYRNSNLDNSTLTSKIPQDALLAAIGLLGYCVIQYFDFPRERIEFQVVLAVLFSILAHRTRDFEFKSPKTFVPVLKYGKRMLMLGLAFNLIIGWERMRGEIHNIRLFEAQEQANWPKVVAESALAENAFYKYNDASIPLAWHEGVAWFQLGKFDKATIALERAYRLNPWNFQVINNYAAALVKVQRFSEAIPLFEKALDINPRYDEGKFNLSFVYSKLGDYPRAASWLGRVDTIANPNSDEDRSKNRAVLNRLKEFKAVLRENQK